MPAQREVQAQFERAVDLHRQGQLAQARVLYEQVLAIEPQHFDALHLLGVIAYQAKQLPAALDLLNRAMQVNSQAAAAYSHRSLVLQAMQRPGEALADCDKAIALSPDFVQAYNNRGNILVDLKRVEEALSSYDKAIALAPDFADARNNRGTALQQLGRLQEAMDCYEKAITMDPMMADAHDNLGNLHRLMRHYAAAIACFDKALALHPGNAKVLHSKAGALREMHQREAALACYDKAIELNPAYLQAHNNRGTLLRELGQIKAALGSFNQALTINPDCAEAFANRANVLTDFKQFKLAVADYDKALALLPDQEFLRCMRLHTRMHLCDWRNHQTDLAELVRGIEQGDLVSQPFVMTALIDSPSLHLKAARLYVRGRFEASDVLGPLPARAARKKIRVAYFSADFREHPVSFLTAQLYELHDRASFEVFAFSFGPDSGDAMHQRLQQAFDQFVDVRSMADRDVAQLARQMEIDIAVDLGGFTRDSRTAIFAMRAAPIQVSYIGYLGTMAAPYIDYLIADKSIIPDRLREHYAEKIIYLPSYQVNDGKRRVSERIFTRQELGLPADAFVFACLNNNYKITPDTYAGWMRILGQAAGSVLLLYGDNEGAQNNLKSHAAAAGIDPSRIVFAGRLPLADYLARYRVVDLFLDTLPYNAGTTASDALWTGLPVLTRCGESFASRVAASVLQAIELPELIAQTQPEYEAIAIKLANDPKAMVRLCEKLARNKHSTALFDTPRFTRQLEAAYRQIHQRHLAGLAPADLSVN